MSNALGQCWIQAVWLPNSSWMIPAGFSRWEVAGSTDFCGVFNRGAVLRVLQDGPVGWTSFRFVHCTGNITVLFVSCWLGLRLLCGPLIQTKLLYHPCSLLTSKLLWVHGCMWYWRLAGSFYLLYLSVCLFYFFFFITSYLILLLFGPLLEDRNR